MKNPGDIFSNMNEPWLHLSLAFACNEMANQLINGLNMEFQGDHQSATAELDLVRSQIDCWLDKLDELDSRGLDKARIIGNLKEARQAVDLDRQS